MIHPVDDGFFGPDSVTWRIHMHRCMLVGGIRALLLQALNPRAMAAVADFSTYKSAPWERLTSTSLYLIDTVFGDRQSATAAIARGLRACKSNARMPPTSMQRCMCIRHVTESGPKKPSSTGWIMSASAYKARDAALDRLRKFCL
ncbi:MAG: hypothetical protein QOD46_1397 [Actinomycetota bacterium]|nr:hypothetical protein [Actinomycetota bacterium]